MVATLQVIRTQDLQGLAEVLFTQGVQTDCFESILLESMSASCPL